MGTFVSILPCREAVVMTRGRGKNISQGVKYNGEGSSKHDQPGSLPQSAQTKKSLSFEQNGADDFWRIRGK
jgi:hypothetical protein